MDQLSRWRERLSNLTVSPLTRDYPEPLLSAPESAQRPIEACETLQLSSDAVAALQQLQNLEGHKHSSFIILLAALVVLTSRLTGDEDIALGSSDGHGLPFVLRAAVDAKESFTQLLGRVGEIFSECASDAVPMEKLLHGLGTSSLYRIELYSFSDPPTTTSNATDLTIYYVETSGDIPQSKGIAGTIHDRVPELRAVYNQRCFASSRISTILSQLLQLVLNASSSPQECIGTIDLMTKAQRMVLPDPRKDLHWSHFIGPIHDIFAANAHRYPERLCVKETVSNSNPQREFTYRQIDEASNIVAHHLIQSGIQRGEVVMVYAHRGVDLVVAVMGALKAGATFSVLDPLYPPDRQIIYLDVAEPRALINLEKATLEAGELTDLVRTFIRDNLHLRTEIPALVIKDDGTLRGGTIEGRDVLHDQQASRMMPTNVVVGPDDIPTLSFTSGSEGIPKGVRGRHFSLAYYFPWMAQRFNLGENDRFTMLSGIAHDPIQRDIFTPLFLGAQLLVPSRDDIQNEKLAEWMQTYGATVTHLTPAMGQILVGNAMAEFPQLHHAFFVGDILIKRDCKSLQRLAPNVRVVNMYGTTETQRAVSYYEIPSFNDDSTYLDNMKDVIPAGKGMSEDVQILVINRADPTKVCGIGEIGEIYVRAGGLAEGYLGLPELTNKKFVLNWFIDAQKWIMEDNEKVATSEKEPWREHYKGPRDRLYRSGDLGRYTPSGDVECSGRADDQVKIRGFRIELGEIDTHLSKHPLIRENVTLVRRDKDEEPTLVSYVVPQMNAWSLWLGERGMKDETDAEGMVGLLRRFRPLRDDVRAYLKTKLPVYAVPTTVIPLRKMPLNPNGKISKPALPFPDISELSAAAPRRPSTSLSALSETESTLTSIWADLLGLSKKMIGGEDSFFDLGGDSIKGNRMVLEVRRTWRGVNISMSAVFQSPKLKDFASAIDRLRDPDAFEASHQTQGGDADGNQNGVKQHDEDYATDGRRLTEKLSKSFPSAGKANLLHPMTVFLTGATGFLGAYILRELLSRGPLLNVVAHVRSKSPESALSRVKQTCRAYGVWSTDWEPRLRCVTGNLGDPELGLSKDVWEELSQSVDIVIHNGALVHWVYPYSTLKAPNVQGTIDALELCAVGRPKTFLFVSSTAVLDNDYYVRLSDRLCNEGGAGVPEDDDLEGSCKGLDIGYGQSKWVSEYLTREAGRRGLKGAIVRPGYISGDSRTGVTNIDDFLIRMVKGCIQLSARPDINNSINMSPVDFVARLVVASALNPGSSLTVVQCTSHPRLRFNEYLGMLQLCCYNVPKVDYIPWRASLERYVARGDSNNEAQHALLPLYHFVTADLPSSTKSPELDDTNAVVVMKADIQHTHAPSTTEDPLSGSAVTLEIMKRYLAYLVAVGFLESPGEGKLPGVKLGEGQREALSQVGGRGGLV